ncbi:short gastrulation [Carabus blaptoides fortunei]
MAKSELFVLIGAIFAVYYLLQESVDARRHSPLLEDNSNSKYRAAECTFGKQVKEIGTSWFADLGPPFGVMYCIKCDCVKVQKKRRVVARVQCRNIKNECPKPSCDEPVLLPGRCCKTCPGDFYTPDIVSDTEKPIIEEDERSKHFAALLTGRSSLVVKRSDHLPVPISVNKNNVVATGRFMFHRKNLYYSFYVSDKAARPRFLQFVDHTGNILEEHALSGPDIITSGYQNVTRKVCGVWKRLPKDYRKLLREMKLYAVLVWGVKDQPEFTLSGQIMKYMALGTELFSSLLEPAPGSDSNVMQGAGATAIVSTSSASTPSIHIAIVFNGIFTAEEIADVPVNITLSLEEKQQIIIEEVKRVEKPAHELNIIEVSSPVSAAEYRLLTRGRLVLSISSVHKPDTLKLSGAVITRATCELFQTTLTSSTADKDQNLTNPSGLAWLYMNSDGALVYNIQIDEVKDSVSLISLVDVTGKKRAELEDLTAYYHNGWANGTLDKLGPRVLEPLYSGNLAVSIALQHQNSPTFIRGRLTARAVAEARDTPAPILLKRVTDVLPSTVVGIAWLSVDNDCHIHYDLTLTGMGVYDKTMQLYLLQMPMLAPGAPVTTRLLEDFKGNHSEDSGNELLLEEELIHLESAVAYLEIREKDSKTVLLKGTVKQIKVPTSCLPSSTDNDVPRNSLDRPTNQAHESCYYEGSFYEEGSDWTTSENPCTMCFCQNGRVKCETATCPVQSCGNKERGKAAPGECCPPCLNNSASSESNVSAASRGCMLGNKFHSAGTRWHPFLVPSGFDRCTECTCDPATLEVKCSRKMCVLDCDEKLAIRADDKSCCKQCPNSEGGALQQDIFTPSMRERRPEEVLPPGSCRKPDGEYVDNGTEYHPRLASIGEYKCVTCKCTNGSVSCSRLKCTRSMCNNTTYRQRRNISESTLEKCCSCKRLRRHHNHRSHGQ